MYKYIKTSYIIIKHNLIVYNIIIGCDNILFTDFLKLPSNYNFTQH